MAETSIHNFQYRIYPSKAQVAKFEMTLDLCRELYNAALQERKEAWKLERKSISYVDQSKQIAAIKADRPELSDIGVRVLRDPLKRVDRAFQNFFRLVKTKQGKAGFPRFKGKYYYNSFTFIDSVGIGIKGSKVRLPKIGLVRIKLHRPLDGKIKTLNIKRDGTKWYATFSLEFQPKPLPQTGEAVGIDVGIEAFATLSDGTRVDNWKYFQSSQKKLRVAQRKVARRVKGSNRRRKAVDQVRRIHNGIHNRRKDFQHKLSTHLVKEYDLIAVEKLNIKGMSRGILSKQILDASWGSFIDKIRYKAENAGKDLIEVSPNYTSQDCSNCGNRVKKALSERQHNCEQCGLSLNRDVNAALNILASGLDVKAITYQTAESVALEAVSTV